MLEYRHVSVSCQRTPILQDVSLSFPEGKITVLTGPNGCGKTTLLQCLNGASRVTEGNIFLNGTDFLKLSPKERAKNLSFLPQVRTVIPSLPVKTLVEHGRFPYLGFARRKTEKDIALVQKAMEFARVEQYADQYADTLSGGIRQRVFFAMALAQDCDILVLDEPSTYLDLSGQRDFLSMITKLKSQGKTIILTMHNLDHALRTADYLAIMGDRKIAAFGTPAECLEQQVIEKIFDTTWKKFEDGEGVYYFFS
ncbi:ABC transporter ATP-binding protein [Lachnospiraceae bacterium]|jgi:iron complex transport system ATP-binding protein|nr:ABC transporter ATP-binding protein [Lachnospiraceae bacterium]